MQRNVCIVHIEDEFHQMKYLPVRLRQYVQQHLLDRTDGSEYPVVSLVVSHTGGADNAEWIVYDIVGPDELTASIRYIFSAAARIPEELEAHILDGSHFIIDVLRVSVDRQALESTAEESIQSALENGGRLEEITIYTACQGSDLDEVLSKFPSVNLISKICVTELNLMLGGLVVRSLGGGSQT
ncbi:MAG: hypothetical protein ACT4N8_06350 [Sphingosinicella sp.]|uniref:hypothetical protein n=1 Tax=Sphingosinicella sp. TaxID=1917971 RepID=UPI0040380907